MLADFLYFLGCLLLGVLGQNDSVNGNVTLGVSGNTDDVTCNVRGTPLVFSKDVAKGYFQIL